MMLSSFPLSPPRQSSRMCGRDFFLALSLALRSLRVEVTRHRKRGTDLALAHTHWHRMWSQVCPIFFLSLLPSSSFGLIEKKARLKGEEEKEERVSHTLSDTRLSLRIPPPEHNVCELVCVNMPRKKNTRESHCPAHPPPAILTKYTAILSVCVRG